MPARPRSADDPPNARPPLSCEVPLRVSRAQERALLARLEAARQVYNACLGEARRRVRLVRQSRAFQHARTLPRDDPARKARFAQARTQHACSEYALHAYAQQFGALLAGRAPGQPDHPDAGQSGLPRCQSAAPGQARRVRFKGRHQLDTVEGKTNTSGLRWCGDRVEWKGLVLPARLDPQDQVQAHGLACPVKYVRLVRRKLGERNRFYAQLVCQGTPYQKPQHQLGSGIVGLDLGPSAIAVVVRAGSTPPAVLPRGGSRRQSAAPAGSEARPAAPGQQPGQLRRAGPGQAGQTALEGVQAPAAGAGAAARGATGSWPPRASAVTGSWPIGCWRWAAPSTWSSSPIGRGRRPTGSRSSSARRACLSSGCLVWLRVLAGPSSRSTPGVRDSPKRATVAASRRKPAPSAGMSAPVAPAPSAISSRPIWHALLTQRRPCSTRVRRRRPGRGGSPPVPPAYEQAISEPTREGQASACRLWSASG